MNFSFVMTEAPNPHAMARTPTPSVKVLRPITCVMTGTSFLSQEWTEHPGGEITKQTMPSNRILTAMGWEADANAIRVPPPYISGERSFTFLGTPEYVVAKEGEEDKTTELLNTSLRQLRKMVFAKADVVLLGYCISPSSIEEAESIISTIVDCGEEILAETNAPIVLVGIGKRNAQTPELTEALDQVGLLQRQFRVLGISRAIVRSEDAIVARHEFEWDWTARASELDPSKMSKAELRSALKELNEENKICRGKMRIKFDAILAACADAHDREVARLAERSKHHRNMDRQRFKAFCPCCCCCCCCAMTHSSHGAKLYITLE